MTDMMTDVIQRGTAQLAARTLGRRDIAGKTGTTSDRRDTWFVGFNADLVAAVWIGFDQERSLGEHEEGGRTALPMWIYFMQEALQRPAGAPACPSRRASCACGCRARPGTPSRAGAPGALFEAFLEQYAPQPGSIDYSDERGRRERRAGTLETNHCSDEGSAANAMSRRPNPRADLLRQAVADEAARIMREQGVDDFLLRQAQGRRAPRRHRRVDPAAQHRDRGRADRAATPVFR